MPAYYADLEFEEFHIANRVQSVVKESEEILDRASKLKNEFEAYDQRNTNRSIIMFGGIIALIAALRYAFSRRKIYYSLVISLTLLLIAGFCCIFNGRPA